MFDYQYVLPSPQNNFADIKRLFFGHGFSRVASFGFGYTQIILLFLLCSIIPVQQISCGE